ncbi:calcium-binding mitochondrial carrier protein SCaMC-1-B-like [Scleropages formosus]|uniref:Calcium-binding mitochondrial carrier protein SCaMC-1-B-like n=1 Tax=Scleropages formosus TaxID=113540 RepID=A0A0P7UZ86_SCLFO|nr:calcium-binding mitochondrial carrier protein SCaMC-1-B-like [Scleropages formosus]
MMDQFRSLFLKLDVNNDGYVSVEELHREMEKAGIWSAAEKAQAVVDKYDKNIDGRLDYEEFLNYLQDRERKWKINFQLLDKNKCGVIDHEEIMCLFKELGLVISKQNAKKIIQMMDKDSSMTVDWGEFLHHIILNPAEDIRELVSSWKHSMVFDVGESRTMPMEFTQEETDSGAWKRYIVAGGLADAVSRTLTAPIDRLKIQLQVYGSKALSQSFKEIQAGGLRSMWQGNLVNVLKGTPQSTLQFFIYNQMKMHSQSHEDKLSIKQRFALGCVSGAVAHAVFYPLEVLKVRLNLQTAGTYSGILGCAGSIYQNESTTSFYRGFKPSVLCMIPYAGVECAVHQSIMSWAKTDPANSKDSRLFFFSFLAFASGQMASYPLAVIRTQQQAKAFSSNMKASSSAVQGLIAIYAKYGIRGFYNGIGARRPSSALCPMLPSHALARHGLTWDERL